MSLSAEALIAPVWGTTTNDGIALAYDVEGSGPALLLIAGLSADRGFWSLARPLLGAFRTIAFDNRDAGASGPAAGAYTVADMARDALAVLDAAGIERAHVLGHSMGGAIAQELAILAPERVGRLVLANTWAGNDGYMREIYALLTKLRRGLEDDHAFLSALYFFGLGGETLRRMPLSAVAQQVLDAGPVQPRDGFLRQIDACAAVDTVDRLSRIKAPTLVLHTPDDKFFAPSFARALASGIPNARLEEVARVGHCPMIEAPDAFAEAVARFLRS